MLTERLHETKDIWCYLKGDEISNYEMYKLTEVSNYLDKNYNEIKKAIKEICFSKMALLGNQKSEITPIQLIDNFIETSQKKFRNVVNMQCIDVKKTNSNIKSGYCPYADFTNQHFLINEKAISNYFSIKTEYDRMTIIADGLKNRVTSRAYDKAYEIKQQLQSNVRGLDYNLYTSSMLVLIAHSIDNMRAIREQQREADLRFERYLSSVQHSVEQELISQFKEYTESIFDPFIDRSITDMFNSFKELIILDYLHHGYIIYD